ncbi:MAG: precorrin-3B synthase [Lyngbya sp. HA4199-MV5]|nr:precorrin-3B synthase [Lyngbya sp. HA4199-MV5]
MSSNALLQSAKCPSLFAPSIAQDGLLYRLRIPGGLLNVAQCEAIADLADQAGCGAVEVTNRANVQIRGLQTSMATDVLERLQELGLASPIAGVDALRNIMASPTAGIDRQQFIDTRPLVAAWNHYLTTRPDFAVLSPKFSVCFDGSEAVSVRDRPNDISLVAEAIADAIYFRVHLSLGDRGASPCDVGVLIRPAESLPLLIAMTEVYGDYTRQKPGNDDQRKPRLRDLLQDWNLERYLKTVADRLPVSLTRTASIDHHSGSGFYNHLGIHAQRQNGLSYLGCTLSLGRLETKQLRGLARLALQFGSGTLRLTPWQTVLVPDVPTTKIDAIEHEIEQLGLSVSATHPHSAIVACSGTTGCKSSATNTQADALALANYLAEHITLDRPINIHFTGCEKSCAQHHASDIALLGATKDGEEIYHIHVGDNGSKFGRVFKKNCALSHVPVLVEQLIQLYQRHRSHSQETFQAFVNRHTIAELKQLLDSSSNRSLLGVG